MGRARALPHSHPPSRKWKQDEAPKRHTGNLGRMIYACQERKGSIKRRRRRGEEAYPPKQLLNSEPRTELFRMRGMNGQLEFTEGEDGRWFEELWKEVEVEGDL